MKRVLPGSRIQVRMVSLNEAEELVNLRNPRQLCGDRGQQLGIAFFSV